MKARHVAWFAVAVFGAGSFFEPVLGALGTFMAFMLGRCYELDIALDRALTSRA